MISVDLHVHTCYSFDSTTSLKALLDSCQRARIDCIGVTDHDTIEGALQLKREGRMRVIVGEEVLTTAGELIGLFLRERVPSSLSPHEAIGLIKGQGGLVCLPHPLLRSPFPEGRSVGEGVGAGFVPSRDAQQRNALLSPDIISSIDIIEVMNARTPFDSNWAAVERLAKACGLTRSAGSDAHTPAEIGNAYVEMDDFRDPTGFLRALQAGRLFGRKAGAFVHVASTLAKLRRTTC